jgi:DNA/RNA-binding domain of Phe-tRNA-synthetase-like protein
VWSAVRVETRTVHIVAEAMHDSASSDVQKLIAALAQAIKTIWPVSPRTTVLDRFSPRFEF